jgi:hypothetical protein
VLLHRGTVKDDAGAVAAAILISSQPPDKACIELDELAAVQLSPQRP